MIAPVLAHAADIAISLIYLAPVLVVVGVLVMTNIRDRRRRETGDDANATNDVSHDRSAGRDAGASEPSAAD